MAGTSIMDALFQRTLDDLIKGLRLCLSGGETSFISKSMDEIRREIKSTDLDTKSTALQKLSYLCSLHFHDMSFASFHVVELISSTRFSHKRIAYQSASQSFNESTPVIVLITNQLRKDLSSKNEYEVSLALECLSRIGTLDLSRDLSPEVFTLLGSAKPLVKRKAIAVTLRVFEKYPDSARVCFKRLVESLDSTDAGVLSAAVGVFSELAARDPASYLPLAPEFFRVLVDCKNNWVLIKVLKIFARLAPLEPRLANRVVEPICDLMSRTGAKSLTFECVRTLLSSFPGHEPAVRLAVGKVRDFLLEDDPNLKYLGLNALSMAVGTHPWAAAENREIVTKSLSDPDPNIKLESLRLVMSMVTESNVPEISRALISHAARADPIFCNEILGSVLATCSKNVYEIVVDFDWYVSVLGDMARVPHCRKGDEIGRQLVDVGTRVRDARPELVRACRDLLIDPALLGSPFLNGILSAAAWASGEYVELSRDPSELVEALVQPRTSLLPPTTRAVYLHSALKALVFCLRRHFAPDEGDISPPFPASLLDKVESAAGPLLASHDVEVLERSRNLLSFVELIRRGEPSSNEIVELMEDAFSDELRPVSATSQERVSLPDGLVLNENLNDLDSLLPETQIPSSSRDNETLGTLDPENESESLNESTSLLAVHRKRHGLYYLPLENKNDSSSNNYPPANEPRPPIDGDNLVKLTEESLFSKKRMSHTKPRPAVVTLDGDSIMTAPAKVRPKDGPLSEAVREALLGAESEPDPLQGRGKEKLSVDSGDLSSRQGKSSRQRGSSKVVDENGGEAKKKSGGRDKHAKRKSRKRTEAVPQSQVIPDFLL